VNIRFRFQATVTRLHSPRTLSGRRSRPKRPRKLSEAASAGDRLSIRIDLASGGKIGPGKIAVLQQVARTEHVDHISTGPTPARKGFY
jgi:hypothetical protein